MSERPARPTTEATMLHHVRHWYHTLHALLNQHEGRYMLPDDENAYQYEQDERVLTFTLQDSDRDRLLAPLAERLEAIEQRLAERTEHEETLAASMSQAVQAVQRVQTVQARLDTIEQQITELTNLHTHLLQTHASEQRALSEQTARLATDQTQTRETLQQMANDLQSELETLKKQVNRSGKEQLKANSLTETQVERLSEALTMLHEADKRREQELLSLHEQRHTEQAAARREVVHAMLPVIDSLEEAMRSGQQMLDQLAQPEPAPAPQPEQEESPGLFGWLFGRPKKETSTPPVVETEPPQPEADATQPEQPEQPPPRAPESMHEGFSVWLEGLSFVIQRMLDILAAEDIHPIEALGYRFDPQRHMAVEVVAAETDTPDGTVVAEIRRGYMEGKRVLRHTEVVVARKTTPAHTQLPAPPPDSEEPDEHRETTEEDPPENQTEQQDGENGHSVWEHSWKHKDKN